MENFASQAINPIPNSDGLHNKSNCINNLKETCNYPLDAIDERREPDAILMCEPAHFQVIDVKNLFMQGNVHKTNQKVALQQWQDLKAAFEQINYSVSVIPAQPGLEDMVFTANQVLLGEDKEGAYVILASMVHDSRRREVEFFAEWFRQRGYRIIELNDHERFYFEGQGDALWHPGKQLLYGGYGHRSQAKVYPILSNILHIPIVLLHLVDPRFYHLDTAFCPLDQHVVMAYKGAFDEEGWQLINHYFSDVISVSETEAENFACNALPLGKNVVIQKGSVETCKQLRRFGFNPIEVETTEFMKSGGSVSCLKMMVYR